MDPIHVEEPVAHEAPPEQTAEKDVIVASVTDDALVMAHEAQAAAPTPEQIAQVAQGADDGMIGVILAIVAVLGGGAGWKFYSQSSKQKAELATKQAEQAHELAMAELNAKMQAPTTSPPPCIAAHTSLEARLAAVEAKASRMTSIDLPDDFDADVLIARVEKIEKALKASKPKPAGRKP